MRKWLSLLLIKRLRKLKRRQQAVKTDRSLKCLEQQGSKDHDGRNKNICRQGAEVKERDDKVPKTLDKEVRQEVRERPPMTTMPIKADWFIVDLKWPITDSYHPRGDMNRLLPFQSRRNETLHQESTEDVTAT
ncbi:hypothetical protein DPMN_056837 [Dreissena polymorpha]|uniref:Uncharacterized protein n=1 Tax=Dreissena polymorpha TaxID=45954 RepID=A0A9D4HTK9_DREPO|nr:hypothetical protein DPMN_056837 [Dreissena polymorpha]